jgi:phage protein D
VNTRTQNRYGTNFQVIFPDFPTFKQNPQWFRLTQEQGKQDVIEISYSSFDNHFQSAFKTGVMFKVKWATEYSKNEWVGYVYNGDNTTQATISCNVMLRGVGASFPLKEGGNKIWKNKTAPEIVQDICKQYKLKAVVDKSNVRFGMQSLVGTTKWEKIQELANRIGFQAHISGTTLYFQRIDKLIDQFMSVIPVMSYNDGSVNAETIYKAQTLDSFTAKLGDLSETVVNKKTDKVLHGIDPVTCRAHSHTAKTTLVGKNVRSNVRESLFKEVSTTVVAESRALAKELSEGMAHLGRFSMIGHGKGQGDPRISPYRTVEINGTGKNSDGFWVVVKAEHFVTYDGRYTVDFECMTDGVGKNKGGTFRKTTASVIGTRDVAYEMATGGKQAPSTPTMSARQPLVNQTRGEFNTSLSRWVGK